MVIDVADGTMTSRITVDVVSGFFTSPVFKHSGKLAICLIFEFKTLFWLI